MSDDLYPGIKAFCAHWSHAPMLQQTLETLERSIADENDACIDAAKAMVECACHILIAEMDDPKNSVNLAHNETKMQKLLESAIEVVGLGKRNRDDILTGLVKAHEDLAEALRLVRNRAGTASHGRYGFLHRLSPHYRRSAVIAADTIVTFLFEAYLEHRESYKDQEPDPTRVVNPHRWFSKSNKAIDKHVAIGNLVDAEIEETEEGASQAEEALQVDVLLPTGETLKLTFTPSQLLLGADREIYKSALNACIDRGKADDKRKHESEEVVDRINETLNDDEAI